MGNLKAKVQVAANKIKAATQNASSNIKTAASNTAAKAQTAAATVKTQTAAVAQKVQKAAVNATASTKAAAKQVATKAATAAKKVVKAGETVAVISLFLPLMPLAIVFLKRKGIKPSTNPQELLTQVYNEMSKKSFGLIEGGDAFDYAGSAEEFGYADEFSGSYGIIPITPAMVMAVIQFLKGIFDTIKAKKAASQPLTADEQTILDKGPEIEKELSAAKDAAAEALAESQKAAAEIENKGANDALDVLNGEGGSKMKWILIIVVVIVILYLFLKRK